MTVGIKTGSIINVIGTSDFLFSFFSTVACLLENNNPGSFFPCISIDLNSGKLDEEMVQQAVNELVLIKKQLENYPPSAVVWDMDNSEESPPWGTNISKSITSLANYFVTNTGRDLIETLDESFNYALLKNLPITIVNL